MMGRGGGRVGGRDRLQGEYVPRFQEEKGNFGKGNNAPPSRHLWVGNLSPRVTESALSEHFLRFGDIESLFFLPGRSYAFINFKKEEAAMRAMRALQGFFVSGSPLKIQYTKGERSAAVPRNEEYQQNRLHGHFSEQQELSSHRDVRTQRSTSEEFYGEPPKGGWSAEPSEVLWIGFPSFLNVDETALQRAFLPFGEIEKITAFPGRSYAFVRYRSIVAACRAKEALQGKLFNHPRVSICFARSDSGPPEQGRNSDTAEFPPNVKSNVEGFGWDRNFGTSKREFPVASPRFTPNMDKIPGDAAGGFGFGRKNNIPGMLEHARFQGVEDQYEQHRNSPAERGVIWRESSHEKQRSPFFEGSWDSQGDAAFRSMKKLKTGPPFADNELPEYPFSDLDMEKRRCGPPKNFHDLPGHEAYESGYDPAGPSSYKGIPNLPKGPTHLPLAGKDDSWRFPEGGPGLLPSKSTNWQRFASDSHQSPPNKEWKWEGTIAKGGTPVCRARCFPVGKALDAPLPDYLNCTARTGLDMLENHFYQASASWVVFFVPETDADIVYYNEFMHYLGEKQRAAVARLGDKNTLFLVPPSEFSEKVLKVPGKVSISGVILSFQQPDSTFTSLPHPSEVMNTKPPSLMHHINDGSANFIHDKSYRKPASPRGNFASSSEHFTSAFHSEKESHAPGESQYSQIQHQNPPALQPNWPSQPIQGSKPSYGSFPPQAPNIPSQSYDAPMSVNLYDPRPQTRPPVPSLQSEQLAHLVSILGQQQQQLPPAAPSSSENVSGSQFSQVQQLQHQPSNISSESPKMGNTENSQGSDKETEQDPQKRLQATLQLAAALLQQIQQASKSTDQQ
ncbi:Flowering time control protein FPA [Acorus gramineus]|uniref:Flowering time control protein FPA n=1 Tax=Acorus gramineus TaxID=55184 RepID=A0AAV9AVK7_ACOGR|nr:Flowering time control protein FPA [Acorus gramineus]